MYFINPTALCRIFKAYFSLRYGFPVSGFLGVLGFPFSSRKNAYKLTENPRACRISCFTVDNRVCSSCDLVLMDSGHKLAWPAIGRSKADSC